LNKIGFKSLGDNVLLSEKAGIYNPGAISIGNNVRIDDFVIITGESDVIIGNYVHVAAYVAMLGRFGIELHDFVGVSVRTTILTGSDDFMGDYLTNPTIPDKYRKVTTGKVVLGKHSLIGSHTVILPGIQIGEGVSVGAQGLVTKNLDDWGIYVGAPCRFIKKRNKNLLELEKKLSKV
jgi:galactoside O-acetyltransferase